MIVFSSGNQHKLCCLGLLWNSTCTASSRLLHRRYSADTASIRPPLRRLYNAGTASIRPPIRRRPTTTTTTTGTGPVLLLSDPYPTDGTVPVLLLSDILYADCTVPGTFVMVNASRLHPLSKETPPSLRRCSLHRRMELKDSFKHGVAGKHLKLCAKLENELFPLWKGQQGHSFPRAPKLLCLPWAALARIETAIFGLRIRRPIICATAAS
ncbi:hypothetical protein CHS0354_012142 [Potamilus streckersoni]|uniref:Uncharacterized protein n=1 Tax=Potamilus streckersoni TaxID=2493646 RepID=A0AAE0SA07_9BIVA|nr:hypothetical protein CHS0354_012142 [Potamilus streckersoni]